MGGACKRGAYKWEGFVRGGLVSGGLVREWSYKWRGL